jgi:galactoside O-acetyltransferase
MHVLKILRAIYPAVVTLDAPKSAIINPMRLRGSRSSRLKVGEQSLVNTHITFERPTAHVTVGTRSWVGSSVFSIAESLDIGDDVHISWDVTIVDHDSHALDFENRRNDALEFMAGRKDWTNVPIAPVKICDKSWVGVGAAILKGVTVGEGAVVGAKAVVTHDVEPWTVVGGNPARFLKAIRRPGADG